ncbi:MAG TPA: zinc ribbon domain-containing protein [Candidatus Hydrogenedens sp.]|nr:zinc ribbon domain-containing protein [Candidatus Hydrogenedens sp.]HOK10016.1 zinc ribbon domain-containing protein [Candidatus Hydrogenedens sp.]HOL21205.1 zinc ribbon domain-containing protein [Candidatus Hydrogenedens sp.]HPP59618.1 zinc ribbon domain-containing protein [Candidatus Hydrogenedens sp.]
MPLYTYQVIHEDGSEGEIIEVFQKAGEPPLQFHPQTGEKVIRIFKPAHIAGWANERMAKQMLSDKNLAEKGFTKYVRSGKGYYEKTTGKEGPPTINVNGP